MESLWQYIVIYYRAMRNTMYMHICTCCMTTTADVLYMRTYLYMLYELTKNIDGNLFSTSPIFIFSYTDIISTFSNISSKDHDAIIIKFWTR